MTNYVLDAFFLSNLFAGIPGTVFNGIADWVYEEEVISDTRALWFSPDSNRITWIEFNDTAVETMPLQVEWTQFQFFCTNMHDMILGFDFDC